VRSPFAGVVLKVFRRAGELVDGTPATPVVEVGDPAVLEVMATVAAAELVQLRAAAPARVSVPAMPGRSFPAEVSLVSPTVERATGLGTVRVRLAPAASPAPPIGVAAIAEIGLGRTRRALWVPAAALHAPTGSDAEVTICGSDGHAHAIRVGVGRQVLDQVELRPAGDAAPADASALPQSAATRITRGTAVIIEPILGVEDGAAIERRP
jgi:HlyD family secretion protein